MGPILLVILTFNLALAHHLRAIETNSERTVMQQVVTLYEIVYRWQLEESHDGNGSMLSLRFSMIITNNLSEIHRAANNNDKHKMCLEQLLSVVMYVVDCQQQDVIELDGFFHNTSRLILQENCASAA